MQEPTPLAAPTTLQKTAPYFLLAASPRAGGNTDTAAQVFLQGFLNTSTQACAMELKPVYLRAYSIKPCVACDACAHSEHLLDSMDLPEKKRHQSQTPLYGCPLSLHDESAVLLWHLAHAPGLCIIAPMYFYHLPSALKALVDRTQTFWNLRKAGNMYFASRPPRLCHVVLLGGRPKGDKLFEGSLLSLKYSLESLNVRLAEPLLLYGLDNPSALLEQPEKIRAIIAYGETAGQRY